MSVANRLKLAALCSIAMVCLWVAWQVQQVSQRQALLGEIYGALGDPTIMLGPTPALEKPIPFIWKVLGARPRQVLYVRRDRFDDAKLRKIRSLFPEAFILVSGSQPYEWVKLTDELLSRG